MVGERRLLFHFDSLNPLVLAALCTALLLYGGILKTKQRYALRSLFDETEILSVSGSIVSNPVRVNAGTFYRADVALEGVETRGGARSSARGIVCVLIPAEIAEAYMPGKLYTRSVRAVSGRGSGDVPVCESGANISFCGHFSQRGVFISETAEALPEKSGVLFCVMKARRITRMHFRRLMFSWGAAGGLILALLSGMREYTEADFSVAFKNAGLSHVLALSGMHLSLFGSIGRAFGFRLFGKRGEALFQLVSVLLFVWFAGLSPSLFRALLCSVLLLLCAACSVQNVRLVYVLCAAFLIHVVLRPYEARELSFMLSYGSLFGILLLGSVVSVPLSARLPPFLASGLSAGSGAFLFTAPVTAAHFHTLTPIGIVATVFVSPLIGVFFCSALVLIVISLLFPCFSSSASFLLKIQYTLIKRVAQLFSMAPHFSFRNE